MKNVNDLKAAIIVEVLEKYATRAAKKYRLELSDVFQQMADKFETCAAFRDIIMQEVEKIARALYQKAA